MRSNSPFFRNVWGTTDTAASIGLLPEGSSSKRLEVAKKLMEWKSVLL